MNYSWLQYAGHLDSKSMLKLKPLLDKRSRYRTGTQIGRYHHATQSIGYISKLHILKIV